MSLIAATFVVTIGVCACVCACMVAWRGRREEGEEGGKGGEEGEEGGRGGRERRKTEQVSRYIHVVLQELDWSTVMPHAGQHEPQRGEEAAPLLPLYRVRHLLSFQNTWMT